MTFVMRLLTSRRRRTKLPCMYTVTVTVASRLGSLGLFMQPNAAFKLEKVPNMFFRSSFNATKSPATFILMAYFVT